MNVGGENGGIKIQNTVNRNTEEGSDTRLSQWEEE